VRVVADVLRDPLERSRLQYAHPEVEQRIERVGASRLVSSDLRDLMVDQGDEPFLHPNVHVRYLPEPCVTETSRGALDRATRREGNVREVVR
jgi:hypothetical protein